MLQLVDRHRSTPFRCFRSNFPYSDRTGQYAQRGASTSLPEAGNLRPPSRTLGERRYGCHHTPKPQVALTIVLTTRVPSHRASAPQNVIPRAAPRHSPISRLRAGGIILRHRRVVPVPIAHPLPNVPRHIQRPAPTCSLWVTSYRRRRLVPVVIFRNLPFIAAVLLLRHNI